VTKGPALPRRLLLLDQMIVWELLRTDNVFQTRVLDCVFATAPADRVGVPFFVDNLRVGHGDQQSEKVLRAGQFDPIAHLADLVVVALGCGIATMGSVLS